MVWMEYWNNMETKEIALYLTEWCRNRIKTASLNDDDARSLCAEWYEWLDPEEENIEVYSLCDA
jgi:hypothetical protein